MLNYIFYLKYLFINKPIIIIKTNIKKYRNFLTNGTLKDRVV